jgi:predicted dehydrogenase
MADTIRWGILGTADIAAGATIPGMKEAANAEPVAVASRSQERADAYAEENDLQKAYGSYEDLLADPEIDAIYNPLPVSLHAEWSIRAAEAGKPVLVEKPFALNAEEARSMRDAFAERDLLLMEGIMYRYHPLTRNVKQMVDEGLIGEVRMVHAQFNADPGDPDDIRLRKETGGGALLDVGCYCVSVMRLLSGQEPESARALATFNENDVDVGFVGTMQFPDGVVGHLGAGLRTQFDCSYGVCGSKGRLLVDWGALCAWPGEDFSIKHWEGEDFEEIVVPAANHYALMIEDYSAALLEGRAPMIPVSESVQNMEALDLLMEDARR